MADNNNDVTKLLSSTALQFFGERKEERSSEMEAMKTAKYWLVVIPGGDDPKIFKADTLETLLGKLKKLEDKDVQVYVFGGQRLHLTTSPNRKLLLTSNHAVGIVDGVATMRRDDDPEFPIQRDGFMGDTALYELLPQKTDNDDDDEETVTEEDFE